MLVATEQSNRWNRMPHSSVVRSDEDKPGELPNTTFALCGVCQCGGTPDPGTCPFSEVESALILWRRT